jgi:hypothetical protein
VPRKKRKKQPIILYTPSIDKTSHYLGAPNIENRYIAWRFSIADMGGCFSCGNLSFEEHRQLWNRLSAFEKMNIDELRKAKNLHTKQVAELENEYRARLLEINLDDVEEMHSFHIDGTCRLWCLKYENIFSVLWWDKEHQVAPVSKRHT